MTNAELAILSLIAEKPCHGYEIESIIEGRGMREWTEIGFSSIYYLLNKLKRNGLIESRMMPAKGKGPARKVYHITKQGAEAWEAASLESIANPSRSHTSFLIGISMLPGLPKDKVLEALRQYQHLLSGRLRHVQQRMKAQQPLPLHVSSMFDYSLALIETEMAWLEKFRKQVETEY